MKRLERFHMLFNKPSEPAIDLTIEEEAWWKQHAWPIRRRTFARSVAGVAVGLAVGAVLFPTILWALGVPWHLSRHLAFNTALYLLVFPFIVCGGLLTAKKIELIRSKRLRDAMLLEDSGDDS